MAKRAKIADVYGSAGAITTDRHGHEHKWRIMELEDGSGGIEIMLASHYSSSMIVHPNCSNVIQLVPEDPFDGVPDIRKAILSVCSLCECKDGNREECDCPITRIEAQLSEKTKKTKSKKGKKK